jgi:small-conductance mechanosensitive channel
MRVSAIGVIVLLFVPTGVKAQRPADERVLDFLDRTIAWYRDIAAIEASATRQKEALLADDLREGSLQTVRHAFQFARADAAIPAAQAQGAPPPDTRNRNLMQVQNTVDERVEQIQARIAELDREMQAASSKLMPSLRARREKLEGDLNLAKARRDALRSRIGLFSGPDTGFQGKIDDLEHSVTELQSTQKTATTPSAAARAGGSQEFHAESAGIVGLTTELFSISRRRGRVDVILRSTDDLRQISDSLRLPLRTSFQAVIRRGDAIAQLPDTGEASESKAARQELDSLLARFKLLSAALSPLGQVNSALDASKASLIEWRNTLAEEYGSAVHYLLLRLGALALGVLVIFFFSELWRRFTMRYVQDMRRRRQLLLLRRIVVGCTIALFIALSLVTEFGSIATFAGFSAAGIALAMQSVILSVVAYFFLVGRWGVRVGDRITVSGITGDVFDIGLFRLYLMEVAGTGLDLYPTGRIVVFPNAVFFQPSALFKQFPGIDYTWCTLSLTITPDSDYLLVEKRLLAVVESIFEEYREEIERQYQAAQSVINLHTTKPRPDGSLRFASAHIEFVVRYPVPIRRMAEVADRLTRELLAVIGREPGLKLAAGSEPKIETAVSSSTRGD